MSEVRIPSSEVRRVTSKHVEQTFEVSVGLPAGYDPQLSYPVLYLLDPALSFGTATECTRLLALGRELPKLIVVGIGYPDANTPEVLALRSRDYTPTGGPENANAIRAGVPGPIPEPQPGGAGNFLSFLREELFAEIDAAYASDPEDRAFFGDSLGGLFGGYTLFHKPDTFRRYVLGSPSLWWDHEITFEYEEAYAAAHEDLAARVFMSVGALEEPGPSRESELARMVSNVRRMSETLEGRRYPGLDLTTHYFEGETHLSVLPATLSRGIREVFAS